MFASGYPLIEAESTTADIRLALNRNGTIYYVVAPMGEGGIPTSGPKKGDPDQTINYGELSNWETLPDGDGILKPGEEPPKIFTPTVESITSPQSWASNNRNVKYGNVSFSTTEAQVELNDLIPNREYIAYFVLHKTGEI